MKRLSFLLVCMICCITTMADNWTDPETGYTWSYTVSDNSATIGENKWATGDLVIPATINGFPVTSIGTQAFHGCSGLTAITIPNSVTSIGGNAFRGCTGLTSITIPNSVTSIGTGAFEACSGLTSVTIPNSVTSIGDYAFYDCSGLTAITIPNSVTSIGSRAFSGCSSLTSVTIPNSVTTIGSSAFRSCSGLTSVTIPNNVTTIGSNAFQYCSGLTSVKVESGNTKYDSRNNCNAIIESSTNTLICGCKNTTIPNSVTSIGQHAFDGCSGLTSITIPNSVTTIGNYAFLNCSGLTSVTIPNSVTSIGTRAFEDTPFFNNTNDGVIYLGKALYAYKGTMPENTNISIREGTITICADAFSGCSALTSVTIPNSVTTIENSAFSGCSGLTSITIPKSVTSIDGSAFDECSRLKSVHISDLTAWCNISFRDLDDEGNEQYDEYGNVLYSNPFQYAYHLFLNGEEITDLVIPNNVTRISASSFSGCSALTSVTIPNSVTTIGNSAFSDCNGLTSVTIPNSVTTIGSSAFRSCSGLTSITIPNNVRSIHEEAFSGCSGLTSVTIPNSVTFIGTSAFYGCTSLTSIISKMVKPCTINNMCFPNTVFNNTTLYVPQGTIDKYQATYGWNKFLHIEELNSSNMCATPTISYKNGKLSYNCETEGAICQTTITDTDVASFSGNEIDLTVTYNISVYATKDGYFDSDVANAALCWIEVNPQNEGITTDVNQIASVAVLIRANGGQLTIEGADDNTTVAAYTLDGVQLGSAVSRNGVATINTNVSAGTVTIVKIGNKSVKVVMR